MKYFFLFLPVVFSLTGFWAGSALAQTPDQAEAITLEDLEVKEPRVLPTSPWYPFKEWERGLQSFFTFNALKKAELELRFANEKAAEAKKVEETQPNNIKAIRKALENYQKAQERLRVRFERLKETSENPNVDKLLEKVAERTVKHEKLFDELAGKFEEKAEIEELVSETKDKIEEAVGSAAAKDEAAKFALRFEKALLEAKGNKVKHLFSLEFLERIEKSVPENTRASVENLKADFAKLFENQAKEFLEKKDPSELRESIKNFPGDKLQRSFLLRELRPDIEDEEIADSFDIAADVVLKSIEQKIAFAENAREQMNRAQEHILKLEKLMQERSSLPPSVEELFLDARKHLDIAQDSFGAKKYGEAFGRAQAAYTIARNGLRILEKEQEPENKDLRMTLKEFELKIRKYEEWIRSLGLTEETSPRAFELLNNAKTHWGFAEEAFEKGDLSGTELHIGHVKGFLRDLAKAMEEIAGAKRKGRENGGEGRACIQLYDPVCGVDGKTYSNECFANVAGVEVKHKGECGKEPPGDKKTNVEVEAESACPTDYNPVCGVDGKVYGNRCRAEKLYGVTVAHEGVCREEKKQGETTPPKPELQVEAVPIPFVFQADDSGFYPSQEIRVVKDAVVQLTFQVRSSNVYFGGLEFRSKKFDTEPVKPGGSTTVEFTADESFEFSSYWPNSGVLKATGKVSVF